MINFIDKPVVLVTGGAAGIGLAVSQEFLMHNCFTFICDVNEAALEEARSTLLEKNSDQSFEMYCCDLTSEQDITDMFSYLYQKLGRLDVLVNNAGLAQRSTPSDMLCGSLIDKIFAVNVRAMILCCKEAIKIFKIFNRGNIINVSSSAGVKGNPFEIVYASSKWAVEGLTKSLAMEFFNSNIAVNSIEPGKMIKTAMSELTYDQPNKDIWVDPAEIAPAFWILANQKVEQATGLHLNAWDLVQRSSGK